MSRQDRFAFRMPFTAKKINVGHTTKLMDGSKVIVDQISGLERDALGQVWVTGYAVEAKNK